MLTPKHKVPYQRMGYLSSFAARNEAAARQAGLITPMTPQTGRARTRLGSVTRRTQVVSANPCCGPRRSGSLRRSHPLKPIDELAPAEILVVVNAAAA